MSSSTTFTVFVFILSGFFAGFTLANVIYFNRLRTSLSTLSGVSVTAGEASALMWINIILLILSLIIFIWSIVRLVSHPRTIELKSTPTHVVIPLETTKTIQTTVPVQATVPVQTPITVSVPKSPAIRAPAPNVSVSVA